MTCRRGGAMDVASGDFPGQYHIASAILARTSWNNCPSQTISEANVPVDDLSLAVYVLIFENRYLKDEGGHLSGTSREHHGTRPPE